MVINGKVKAIVYRNNENGYTVVELAFGFNEIVATGKFPIVGIGENLELTGEFKINKTYGEQFVVESLKIEKPTDINSIIKYLSCGLIRGIGEVTARNIVMEFGKSTLDVIDKTPNLLTKIRGINSRKADEIHNTYQSIRKMQESVMFLQKYDISISTAIKIYDKYKQKTEEVLMNNPYVLIEDIDGIGFKSADKIAMKIGINFDSNLRIRAGIIYVLNEIAEKQGSTVALYNDIVMQTLNVLEYDESFLDKVEQAIIDLEISGQIKKVIYNEQEAVAVSKYFYMEKYIARKLMNICTGLEIPKLGTEKEIEQYEILNNITLHEKQKEAILTGTNECITIITGGPGTGKTTIIKGILKIFKNAKLKCMLMAPTGRAAKRLEEQTGEFASTIHRALEANFQNGRGFNKNENNPLEADVIIIDEVSMLDVFLMNSLLKAVNFGTRLIFVGDKDQLPSVGAGNVLSDLINSKKFNVVELTQIFRQSDDSMIVVNAHKINNSQMPDLKIKSSDFFYSSVSEPSKIATEVVSLVSERMPNYFKDITSEDIQVIAPMKAGLAGVENLNVLLQDKLNPASSDKKEFTLHKRIFREGDRVMQVVNNYDRCWEKYSESGYAIYGNGVFNGDMGKIESINIEINELYIIFDDGRRACYSYAELEEIVLSYAITIHKSQGSEFSVVIIPVVGGNPLLMNKNLLYTAVTRAKKVVVLIGKSSNIFYMVNNKDMSIRNTMLKILLESGSEII